MDGQDQVKAEALEWLLEPSDPGVRYLAMRDLLDLPADDPQLQDARKAAYQHGPIAAILEAMQAPGYWEEDGPGYYPKYRGSVWSLVTLAQLGASAAHDERIARACAYILDQALAPGGQFSASGTPAGTADCLQGNLCGALLDLGYDDPRLELAFDWMARSVTGEASLRLQSGMPLYAIMPASTGRASPAARIISSPAPGVGSRSCWLSAACL